MLQWKSAEVADAIGYQHRRQIIACCSGPALSCRRSGPAADRLSAPDSPEARTVGRHIAAFEVYDIDRLSELFTAERFNVARIPAGHQGAQAIVTLFTNSARSFRLAICA